jgi:hypothetical protein
LKRVPVKLRRIGGKKRGKPITAVEIRKYSIEPGHLEKIRISIPL